MTSCLMQVLRVGGYGWYIHTPAPVYLTCRGFHPITYPWVHKIVHTVSLSGKTHQIFRYRVHIAISRSLGMMAQICSHSHLTRGAKWYGYLPTISDVQRSLIPSLSSLNITSDTLSISEYSNRIWMLSISIRILFNIANTICI